MGGRRGDDAEGQITSTGRIGKGSPNGWQNGRDRTDADSTPISDYERDPIPGWGKDGKDDWR